MKKSYKKRRKKIKGGNQTKELENLNNLFLNRKYKLAITKDGKEEMYDVKYTGPQQNSQEGLSYKFSHIFKMQHSKFNTDSDLNSYSWKLLVPSISPRGIPRSNDGEQADRSPEQGGGKKKRSRKRSTKKKARNKKKTRKKRGGRVFRNPIYIYSRGDPLSPPPNAYYNPNWMELMGQDMDSQEARVLLSNLDLRKASAWMKFKAKILEKNFLYYEEKDRQDLNLNKAVFKIVVSDKSQNEKNYNSHSFKTYKIKRSDLIESINNNSDYIPMYLEESLFAITAKKSKLEQKTELNQEEILKFTEAFKLIKEDDLYGRDTITSGEVLEVLKELRIDYDEVNVYELFEEVDDKYGYGGEIELDPFLILMKKLTKPKFEEVFLWGDEGVLFGLIEINNLNTGGRDNFYYIPSERSIVPIIFKSNREEQEKRKKARIIEKQKKAKSLKKKGGKRKRTRRRRR